MREESWKAVNPENPYDTIDVIDPADPSKVERRVIKIEGSSVKHGTWKYFDNSTGLIVRTENYFLDKLEVPSKMQAASSANMSDDSTNIKSVKSSKVVPKEVLEFEKKIGKKKIKVIDGSTH